MVHILTMNPPTIIRFKIVRLARTRTSAKIPELQQFYSDNKPPNVDIKLHSCGFPYNSNCSSITVAKTDNIKYLGVVLEDRLSLRSQLMTSRVRNLRYVDGLDLRRTITLLRSQRCFRDPHSSNRENTQIHTQSHDIQSIQITHFNFV